MKLQISLAGEIVEGGLYSSVKPIGTCVSKWNMLMEAVRHLNPDDMHKIHCTVLYSRNKNNASGHTTSLKAYAANVKEFTSWVGHDQKRYVVALLQSPSLQKAFKDWRDLGYTSDYEEYKPHITIKKGVSQTEADELIDLLTIAYFKNPFILTFGPQSAEPLRD